MKALIFALLFSGLVHAGPTSSGGGAAYVCREGGKPNGKIIKPPILYDLFEAWADPDRQFKIKRTSRSADQQVQDMVKKLDPFYQVTLNHALGLVNRDWKKLRDKKLGLDLSSDIVPKFKLKDPCWNVELVAHYYDDTSSLVYDDEIYRALRNTDKAALKIHEAVYRLRRYFDHDPNSVKTRRIVANIVMGKPMENDDDLPTLAYDLVSGNSVQSAGGEFDVGGLDLLLGGKTITCLDPKTHAIMLQASVQNSANATGEFQVRWLTDTPTATRLQVPYEISADKYLFSVPDGINANGVFGYDLVKLSNLVLTDDGSLTGVSLPLTAVLEDTPGTLPATFPLSYSYTPERGDATYADLTCSTR